MTSTKELLIKAKAAVKHLRGADSKKIDAALGFMADALTENEEKILAANKVDIDLAQGKISPVMIDRLALSKARIEDMARGIREIAALPSPLGKVLKKTERPNGLVIERISVAMGVIAIIYESRPNVTSDAAALAIKSGSVCLLRAGKEAYNSARAIVDALCEGLGKAGITKDAILLVSDTTRESAMEIMRGAGYVDLLIPRGGAGLIKSCIENATIPCLQTGTGICHIYVDKSADFDMALSIIENAKTSRPSVCNAAEVCLVHKDIKDTFLPLLKERLTKREKNPVELITDKTAYKVIGGTPAADADFDTEFLDYKLAVGVVDSVEGAVEHINAHSTMHSESIITTDSTAAEYFTASVDSSSVYVNASTRFTDGGEFGLGCEMGISTQKLHARGPVGIEELTTYKYVIHGNGQVR